MNTAFNILVVEDEVRIAETVVEYLRREGFSVKHAVSILDAENLIREADLLILDLMLPDGNGESLCEYAVNVFNIPVIILTSKTAEQSIINGFACGADDYLKKPFSLRELTARVKAVLKRSNTAEEIISLDGGIAVDLQKRTVSKNGRDINLTPSEYRILLCLLKNPHSAVDRDKLIESAGNAESFDRTIDVHISRLRQKIGDDPKQPKIIKTVRGYGYILNTKVSYDKR
jgi:DNA-binding response OmpR family regulator